MDKRVASDVSSKWYHTANFALCVLCCVWINWIWFIFCSVSSYTDII